MSDYKEIYIRGYKRKNGSWVNPHVRTVKIRGYGPRISIRSYSTIDPSQLCMDFSGKTTTNDNS